MKTSNINSLGSGARLPTLCTGDGEDQAGRHVSSWQCWLMSSGAGAGKRVDVVATTGELQHLSLNLSPTERSR
jgi:hypothetical protein